MVARPLVFSAHPVRPDVIDCSSASCSARSWRAHVDPRARRVHDPADAEDGADHADGGHDHAGRRLALGTVDSSYYNHGWVVASYIVVGVMAVIALGLLEPANIAVLVELKKPRPNPR